MPKADLAEFEAMAKRTPNRCVIGRHLEALSEKDRVNLAGALAAEHIPHGVIARWLKQHQLPAADKTVAQHRKGECCCV